MLSALCAYDPEIESYVHRCQTDDSASMTDIVKAELKVFNKWIYAVGLRDGSGGDHILREASFATTTFTHRRKLWWIPGNSNSMDARIAGNFPVFLSSGTSTQYGWEVVGDNAFNMRCRCSQFSSNDCSISLWHGWHSTSNAVDSYIGGGNSINDMWGFYTANTATDNVRYIVGSPSASVSSTMYVNNYRGLNVASKKDSNAWIYHNGEFKARASNLSTNAVFPAVDVFIFDAANGNFSIAGFVFGKSIPESLQKNYFERMQSLMVAVDSRRSQSLIFTPTPFSTNGMRGWFDSRVSYSIDVDTANNNRVTRWTSLVGNSILVPSTQTNTTAPTYDGTELLVFNGSQALITTGNSDKLYCGTFALVFRTTTNLSSTTDRTESICPLGIGASNFTGLHLGEFTGNFIGNEIFGFGIGNGRVGLTAEDNNFTITANQNHYVIFVRRSASDWSIYYDGASRPVGYSSAANTAQLAELSNQPYVLGGVNTVALAKPMRGSIGELMTWDRALSTQEATEVSNYLNNKWRS